MAEKSIQQILDDAKDAKIIAEGKHGRKYVSFDDYVALTTRDAIMEKDKVRIPEMNPDGTPAGSYVEYVAVSFNELFLNRYKVEDDKLLVVTDWWSINEQESGRLPRSRVPAFQLGRDGKKLVYEKTITVSADDFLANFTRQLDREAMAQVLPLITRGDKAITEDKLPI